MMETLERQAYEEEQLYPKFDLTDKDGHEIRDAKFYPFVSNVITNINKVIAADYKYQTFEIEE